MENDKEKYEKLRTYLNELALLPEEVEMWLDAGFYVSVPQATNVSCFLLDGATNKVPITTTVARNLRKAVIWRRDRTLRRQRNDRAEAPAASDPVIEELEARNSSS